MRRRPLPCLAVVLGVTLAGCATAPRVDRTALARILDLQDRRVVATAELTEFLHAPNRLTRSCAARALGILGATAAAPTLARALADDPALEVRRAAAFAGSRLPEMESALARALRRDPDAEVRRIAAAGVNPADGGDGLPALVAALGDPEPAVRGAAGWRLGSATPTLPPAARALARTALLDAWHRETDATALLACTAGLAAHRAPGDVALFAAIIASAAPAADPAVVQVALRSLADHPLEYAPSPELAAALRRHLQSTTPALVAAAADAIAALSAIGQAPELRAQMADLDALRRALARATNATAVRALGTAIASLEPPARLRAAIVADLEPGASLGAPALRAARLQALATIDPQRALPLLQHAVGAGHHVVRAAAGEALAQTQSTDASEALTLALFDRVPAVAGATLEAYAANGNAPAAVRAIHRAAPGLLALLPEIVRNGIDADLTQRLLDWASMPIGDPVARALAATAALALQREESAIGAAVVAALAGNPEALVAHCLPNQSNAPWPVSAAPARDDPAPWQLLTRRVQLRVRTTRGTLTIALEPLAAPIHVHALMQRLQRGEVPSAIVASDAERIVLGDPRAPRPTAAQVLRREPSSASTWSGGVVGFATLPLSEIDARDLFITKCAAPDLAAGCTVVGRVIDGMGTVESLESGDRILHIAWTSEPN